MEVYAVPIGPSYVKATHVTRPGYSAPPSYSAPSTYSSDKSDSWPRSRSSPTYRPIPLRTEHPMVRDARTPQDWRYQEALAERADYIVQKGEEREDRIRGWSYGDASEKTNYIITSEDEQDTKDWSYRRPTSKSSTSIPPYRGPVLDPPPSTPPESSHPYASYLPPPIREEEQEEKEVAEKAEDQWMPNTLATYSDYSDSDYILDFLEESFYGLPDYSDYLDFSVKAPTPIAPSRLVVSEPDLGSSRYDRRLIVEVTLPPSPPCPGAGPPAPWGSPAPPGAQEQPHHLPGHAQTCCTLK